MNDERQIRILIVDDDPAMSAPLKAHLDSSLEDLRPTVVVVNDFNEAGQVLRAERFDLAILDVLLGRAADENLAGRELFDMVSEAQWLPVIFYTAVPDRVEDLARGELVQVVNKRDYRRVPKLVRDVLNSGIPQFTRRVASELDAVLRAFLRDHVAPEWEDLGTENQGDILPQLANRLSTYLRTDFLNSIELTGTTASPWTHPSSGRYYLVPPVGNRPTTGDLLRHNGTWWVLVTPQCDLVDRFKKHVNQGMKAEYLRLVPALPLSDSTVGRNYLSSRTSTERRSAEVRVKAALIDDHRYFYLPASGEIPHLMVDMEQVTSALVDDILGPWRGDGTRGAAAWERHGTIDAPYAQALLYRLARATSRVGIEDIPPAPILKVLEEQRLQAIESEHTTEEPPDTTAPPGDNFGS